MVAAVAALENLFPVLPADLFVLAAAVLAARGGGDPVVLGLAAAVANAAGAFAVYLAARLWGPAFLSARIGRWLVRPAHLTLLERLGRRHGWWVVGAARALPGVRAMVPVVAGLSRVHPLPVMLPTVLVASVWYGVIAWLGGRAGADLDGALGTVKNVGGVLTVLAVLATALPAWGWWRVRRRDGGDAGEAGGAPGEDPAPAGPAQGESSSR